MTSAYFSEEHAIVAAIDPQVLDDGSVVSEWVDMSYYRQVAFIVSVGATDRPSMPSCNMQRTTRAVLPMISWAKP